MEHQHRNVDEDDDFDFDKENDTITERMLAGIAILDAQLLSVNSGGMTAVDHMSRHSTEDDSEAACHRLEQRSP